MRTSLAQALLFMSLAMAAESWSAGNAPYTIGYVSLDSDSVNAPMNGAFRSALRELGYVEGENISIESRFAANDPSALPRLVSELITSKVDILVTDGTLASLAAKRATKTIPIVIAASGDTVASGLVASLAHPGGNVTGLTLISSGLIGKRLGLLKELAPGVRRVGILLAPDNPSSSFQFKEAQAAAPSLGIQLYPSYVRRPADLEPAMRSFPERIDALYVSDDPVLDDFRNRIGAFSIQRRLPSICGYRMPEDTTCLMWYGPDLLSLFRRAATYVARILKGAKPAELPVEQPTNFTFAIKMKTANTIGIAIPQSLMLRADEIVR